MRNTNLVVATSYVTVLLAGCPLEATMVDFVVVKGADPHVETMVRLIAVDDPDAATVYLLSQGFIRQQPHDLQGSYTVQEWEHHARHVHVTIVCDGAPGTPTG